MMDTKALCGVNSCEQKYYFNRDFSSPPQSIQDELHIICVLYTEDVDGILTMGSDDSGSLEFKVTAPEEDYPFDEIGGVLRIEQYQEERRELPKALELYHRIFFLGGEITPGEDGGEQMKSRIRNTLLENNVILTPTVGVTDLPFHLLCHEQGAGCVVTEMVSAKAILYDNRNTEELLQIRPQERPTAAQLLGSDPEIVREIIARIEDGLYDFIDMNMGCPVPRIVNNGEGSALMKDPEKAGEIPATTVRVVKKPVTMKFRKGSNDSCVSGVEFARMTESCGVTAAVVHGWIRERCCSNKADWDIIRRVKETMKISVVGNGDVFTPQDAKRVMGEADCDGPTAVRGAEGNPWIFRRINHYLDTEKLLPEPSVEEIREMVLRHGCMLVEYKGEFIAMREMQGCVARYTKGMPYSAVLRDETNQVEILEGLAGLLNQRVPVNIGGRDGSRS